MAANVPVKQTQIVHGFPAHGAIHTLRSLIGPLSTEHGHNCHRSPGYHIQREWEPVKMPLSGNHINQTVDGGKHK